MNENRILADCWVRATVEETQCNCGSRKNQATVHVELEASFCSRRAVEKEKLLTATFDRVDVSASACFSSETSDDAGAEDVLSTVGTLAVR